MSVIPPSSGDPAYPVTRAPTIGTPCELVTVPEIETAPASAIGGHTFWSAAFTRRPVTVLRAKGSRVTVAEYSPAVNPGITKEPSVPVSASGGSGRLRDE